MFHCVLTAATTESTTVQDTIQSAPEDDTLPSASEILSHSETSTDSTEGMEAE